MTVIKKQDCTIFPEQRFKLCKMLESHKNPWPKLVLQNKFKQQIAFILNRTRYTINITNNKAFKNISHIFYGTMLLDLNTKGTIIKWNQKTSPNCRAGIQHILSLFLQNPAKYAKAYGDETHHCMFCNKKLTNILSIDAGYGAICASNFGLPWGDIIKDTKQLELIKETEKITKNDIAILEQQL